MSTNATKLVLNQNGIQYLSQGDRNPSLNIEYFLPIHDNAQDFDSIDITSVDGEVGTVKTSNDFFVSINQTSAPIVGSPLFNRGNDLSAIDPEVRYVSGEVTPGVYRNYLLSTGAAVDETTTAFDTATNANVIQPVDALDNTFESYTNKYSDSAQIRQTALYADNFFKFSSYRPNSQYIGSAGNQALIISGQFEGPIAKPSVYRNIFYNKIALFATHESVYFSSGTPAYEGARVAAGGIRKSLVDSTRYKEPVFLGMLYYSDIIPSGIAPDTTSVTDITYSDKLNFLTTTILCRVASQFYNEADLSFDIVQSTVTGFSPVADYAAPDKNVLVTDSDIIIADTKTGLDGNYQAESKLTIFSNASDKSIIQFKDDTDDILSLNYRSINSTAGSVFATELVTGNNLPLMIGTAAVSGTIGTFTDVISIGDAVTLETAEAKTSSVSIGNNVSINHTENSVSIGDENVVDLVDSTLVGNAVTTTDLVSSTIIANESTTNNLVQSVVIGTGANVGSSTTSNDLVSIGNNIIDSGDNSVVIGNNAELTTVADSIVLYNSPDAVTDLSAIADSVLIGNKNGTGDDVNDAKLLMDSTSATLSFVALEPFSVQRTNAVELTNTSVKISSALSAAPSYVQESGLFVYADRVELYAGRDADRTPSISIDSDSTQIVSFSGDEITITDASVGPKIVTNITRDSYEIVEPFNTTTHTKLSATSIRTETLQASFLDAANNFVEPTDPALKINAENKLTLNIDYVFVPASSLPIGAVYDIPDARSYGSIRVNANEYQYIASGTSYIQSTGYFPSGFVGVPSANPSDPNISQGFIVQDPNRTYFNTIANDCTSLTFTNSAPFISSTAVMWEQFMMTNDTQISPFSCSWQNFRDFGSRINGMKVPLLTNDSLPALSDNAVPLLISFGIFFDATIVSEPQSSDELLANISEYVSTTLNSSIPSTGRIGTTTCQAIITPRTGLVNAFQVSISVIGAPNLLENGVFILPSMNIYNALSKGLSS